MAQGRFVLICGAVDGSLFEGGRFPSRGAAEHFAVPLSYVRLPVYVGDLWANRRRSNLFAYERGRSIPVGARQVVDDVYGW